MTDFETHPAGTADLVKRLRSYQEFEQNRDGQIVCVESEIANEAADRIEQLVATVEQLDAALTRANAATAAAYEVAARVITDRKSEMADVSKTLVGTEKIIFAEIVSLLDFVASAIRALATIDQTAALDKLIAEAETRVWEKAAAIAYDYTPEKHSGATLASHVTGRSIEAAILAASKKGGV